MKSDITWHTWGIKASNVKALIPQIDPYMMVSPSVWVDESKHYKAEDGPNVVGVEEDEDEKIKESTLFRYEIWILAL